MVRDGAEPVIGPRFARTRWRLLTMRGGCARLTFGANPSPLMVRRPAQRVVSNRAGLDATTSDIMIETTAYIASRGEGWRDRHGKWRCRGRRARLTSRAWRWRPHQ